MATLGRGKKDGHFFILVGPSTGTKQIKAEGKIWLLKQPGYRLRLGEKVLLHPGDYRYLKDKKYLYTKGITYDHHEIPTSSSLNDDEIEKDGPALLLRLDRDRISLKGIPIPWTLIIKLDELDEQAQCELRQKQAVGISVGVPNPSYSSMLGLRWLPYASHWPEVTPQLTPYHIYYRDSQKGLFQLTYSFPTQGLEGGWRGNIFLKFDSLVLPNTWRRSRIDEQLSIDDCKEFYWLAQSGQEPEEWLGTTQPIGPAHEGWQLWHLQIKTVDVSWEATRQWFSYRLINLIRPAWHLSIINPFHSGIDEHSISSPDQLLLLCCDPPDQQSATFPADTTLSFTPLRNAARQKPVSLQSNRIDCNKSSYFYTPTLTVGQEYRIRVQDEATGTAISTHIRPLSRTQPSWLRGLRCTLIGSRTQYTFNAFSNTAEGEQSFNLRVPNDFSLEDFSELIWELEPAGVTCSLIWDYCTLQGEICHRPYIKSLSEKDLNNWWQLQIWPTIADSSWARITLDAESFGQIELTLHIKSEQADDNHWWRDEQLSATLIWLSTTSASEPARHTHPVLPALRDTLLRLGEADELPPMLASALHRLARRSHIPGWVQVRLQRVVSDIQHKRLFGQTAR